MRRRAAESVAITHTCTYKLQLVCRICSDTLGRSTCTAGIGAWSSLLRDLALKVAYVFSSLGTECTTFRGHGATCYRWPPGLVMRGMALYTPLVGSQLISVVNPSPSSPLTILVSVLAVQCSRPHNTCCFFPALIVGWVLLQDSSASWPFGVYSREMPRWVYLTQQLPDLPSCAAVPAAQPKCAIGANHVRTCRDVAKVVRITDPGLSASHLVVDHAGCRTRCPAGDHLPAYPA